MYFHKRDLSVKEMLASLLIPRTLRVTMYIFLLRALSFNLPLLWSATIKPIRVIKELKAPYRILTLVRYLVVLLGALCMFLGVSWEVIDIQFPIVEMYAITVTCVLCHICTTLNLVAAAVAGLHSKISSSLLTPDRKKGGFRLYLDEPILAKFGKTEVSSLSWDPGFISKMASQLQSAVNDLSSGYDWVLLFLAINAHIGTLLNIYLWLNHGYRPDDLVYGIESMVHLVTTASTAHQVKIERLKLKQFTDGINHSMMAERTKLEVKIIQIQLNFYQMEFTCFKMFSFNFAMVADGITKIVTQMLIFKQMGI